MVYEKAAKHDFIIDRGSFFQRTLTIKDTNGNPVDLTNYDAEMDIRITAFSEETALQLDTPSNSIVLGGTEGTISIIINPTVTEALSLPVAVYDIKLIPPSDEAEFILYGNLKINRTVTR